MSRAVSSIVALAPPLSITPSYQVSWWPENRMKGASGRPSGIRSACRIGVLRQPVSTSAVILSRVCPPESDALRRAPSASFTVTTAVAGRVAMSAASGLPQMLEMHISCRCSCGITCTCPTAPARLARRVASEAASPSITAMRPRRSTAAKFSGVGAPTITASATIPSGPVARAKLWVMHSNRSEPSSRARAAAPGRLI